MQANNKQPMSAVDRSARSVFVGNISYEISEEQLRSVFSQAGQVVHFRLVHDRETGRPKGFGFCEFADVQTAEAAQRNLNGFELNGRPLRVDSATGGERSADEVQQFQLALASQAEETNPYGPEPELGKAPEAIARTVASMPPERMFELMKQMKETVNNNPQMARHLLMENPQLAYALLQAQVVMRVVDPKVAYSMLHREKPMPIAPFHQQAMQQQNAPPSGLTPHTQPAVNYNIPPPQMSMKMPPPGQLPPVTSGYNVPPPHVSHPPPNIPGMQQPSVSAPVPAATRETTSMEEQQQAEMLVKVLQLTDEQIRLLPPEDRAKVIELRNQLRQQVPS
uniref:RRM domain-containing protein n=2 Tax=Ditylenchus dipsaci TaxID=166011 RepID=A0A915E9E8_9BILA